MFPLICSDSQIKNLPFGLILVKEKRVLLICWLFWCPLKNGFLQEVTSGGRRPRIRRKEVGNRRNLATSLAEADKHQAAESQGNPGGRRGRWGGFNNPNGQRSENTGENFLPGGAKKATTAFSVQLQWGEGVLHPTGFGDSFQTTCWESKLKPSLWRLGYRGKKELELRLIRRFCCVFIYLFNLVCYSVSSISLLCYE